MIYSIAILIILYYYNRRHWRVRVDLGSALAHQIRPSSVKGVGVGDPITLMDSDPLITFMKVIVTFYPLLWIRLLVSFIAIYGYGLRDCKSKYTPT